MPKDPEEALNNQKLAQQEPDQNKQNRPKTPIQSVKYKGKVFKGLKDRFPPGHAWYHNVHTAGQLGFVKSDNPIQFYP